MTLTQNGTAITGTVYFPAQWCAVTSRTGGTFKDPMPTIDDQGNVYFPRISVMGRTGNFLDFHLTGKLDSTGRKVIGQIFESGFSGEAMTLTRQ